MAGPAVTGGADGAVSWLVSNDFFQTRASLFVFGNFHSQLELVLLEREEAVQQHQEINPAHGVT